MDQSIDDDDQAIRRLKSWEILLTDGPVPVGILTVEITPYQTVPLSGPRTLAWSPPPEK